MRWLIVPLVAAFLGCQPASQSTPPVIANVPAVPPRGPRLIDHAPAGTRLLISVDATIAMIRPRLVAMARKAGCTPPAGPHRIEIAGTDAGGWVGELTGGVTIADVACAKQLTIGPSGTIQGPGFQVSPIADGVRIEIGEAADLAAGAPAIAASFPRDDEASLAAVADLGPRTAPIVATLRVHGDRSDLRLRFADPATAIAAEASVAEVVGAIEALGRGAFAPPTRDQAEVRVTFGAIDELVRGQIESSILESFAMPSISMFPTLDAGDHVLVLKGALLGAVSRGDVVIFERQGMAFAKRVVGVAGDVVAIAGGQLVVNGQAATTTAVELGRYSDVGTDGAPVVVEAQIAVEHGVGPEHGVALMPVDAKLARDDGPWTVPPGDLFILGDNRDNASDSRHWGTIPTSAVVGRVVLVWYSFAGGQMRYDRALLPIR